MEPVLKKMEVGESLLDFSSEGTAWVALTNPSHLTRVLRKGTTIGDAFGAEPVDPGDVLVTFEVSRIRQRRLRILTPIAY